MSVEACGGFHSQCYASIRLILGFLSRQCIGSVPSFFSDQNSTCTLRDVPSRQRQRSKLLGTVEEIFAGEIQGMVPGGRFVNFVYPKRILLANRCRCSMWDSFQTAWDMFENRAEDD
jgi:hypothetical protein